MLFTAFLRLLSGDKGNLFKEMVTFNSSSSKKNALVDEEDFVNGWGAEATTDDRLLKRLKYIASNIDRNSNGRSYSYSYSYNNSENIVQN